MIQCGEDGKTGLQVAQESAAGSEEESNQGGPGQGAARAGGFQAPAVAMATLKQSLQPTALIHGVPPQPGQPQVWGGARAVAQEKGCSGTRLSLLARVQGQSWG